MTDARWDDAGRCIDRNCEECYPPSDPEEHTDRMARHMEEDADIARLNALMDGLE